MTSASSAIIVTHDSLRERLRALREALDARGEEIAALELDIESLRESLYAFEVQCQAHLAREHSLLSRVRGLVEHLERWCRLLRERFTEGGSFRARVRRVEARRKKEAERMREAEPAGPSAAWESEAPEAPGRPDAPEDIKSLYRSLAKRFHPDLARSEEERVRFGELMLRINALYAERDLEGLRAFAEQQKGGELDDPEESLEAQLQRLEERKLWFDRVLENLREEWLSLERTPTCVLFRRAQEALAKGEDIYAELREELQRELDRAYRDIAQAARRLEKEVERFNKSSLASVLGEVRGKKGDELARIFDPYANKRLVRLTLSALSSSKASRAARERAEALERMAETQPGLLRLLLFTHVCELSPLPLPGLESFDDLKLRFEHVADEGDLAHRFEAALAEGASMVEYAVRQVSDRRVRTGLRFREDLLREALPMALRAHGVRVELRRVLESLGERARCTGCAQDVFAIPLFRTRGLDDLRSLVCPRCCHTLRSYWMPRGDDVQSVLNDAFLDLEVVSEWSFRLSRASVALQLLPRQAEALTVGDLKERLWKDLFAKNDLPVKLGQLSVVQDGAAVDEDTVLAELEDQSFSVRLDRKAEVTAAEALELIRHRVRSRFRRA